MIQAHRVLTVYFKLNISIYWNQYSCRTLLYGNLNKQTFSNPTYLVCVWIGQSVMFRMHKPVVEQKVSMTLEMWLKAQQSSVCWLSR